MDAEFQRGLSSQIHHHVYSESECYDYLQWGVFSIRWRERFPATPHKNLKGTKGLETDWCTLLIGQRNSDQSQPCTSDLKTTWRQHHDSTAKVHC